MNSKKWLKMNDRKGITIDLDSIDAYYTEISEFPRIYICLNGIKIVLHYNDVEKLEYDLEKIRYGFDY